MIRKLIIGVAVLLVVAFVGVLLVARSLLGSESVRARVKAQLEALTGQPVAIGSAGASVFPRVALQLEDVRIGEPASLTVTRLSVTTGLRGLLSRRIEDAEVLLSDANLVLPLRAPLIASSPTQGTIEPGPPAGPAPTPPAAAPQESGGLTIASVRIISVENLVVAVSGRQVRIDLESALDGDRLTVSRLTARSDRSSLEASGAMESVSRLDGNFSVTGKPLDLDELLALSAGLAGSGGATGSRDAPTDDGLHVVIKVSASEGRVAGYDFSALSTTVDVAPARISLSPLSIAMFGGRFTGTMRVDPRREPVVIETGGAISNMDVAALAEAAGNSGAITGRLNARVSLSARGVDAALLLKSVRGSADGTVTDGQIPGLDMVRAIVLAFGKPSGAPAPGSGSAFSQLSGTFELAQSTLTSKNLALASRDFDLAGDLRMTVPDGRIDARVDVTLSEELTRQAGTDLRRYGEENGRVVLPARISGSLAEPVVTVDVTAAMKRALQNELKRRGKSLLDRLFKKGRG